MIKGGIPPKDINNIIIIIFCPAGKLFRFGPAAELFPSFEFIIMIIGVSETVYKAKYINIYVKFIVVKIISHAV